MSFVPSSRSEEDSSGSSSSDSDDLQPSASRTAPLPSHGNPSSTEKSVRSTAPAISVGNASISYESDVADEEESPPVQSATANIPAAPTEAEAASAENPPRFAALTHRNFRLFWTGNLISLVGTMAQQTALSWLVRTLTTDPAQAPTNLSVVAACNTFPILFFTLYAGVVADRVDKRRALFVTNMTSALLAITLAALIWLKVVQVWQVALIAVGVGTVNAFDIPIRQSFNVEMVGRRDLPNAIALNSSAFNGARVVGPAVGAFLMGAVGMAGCFLLDAFSYLALVVALKKQRLSTAPRADKKKGLDVAAIREGFDFVRTNPTLATLTVVVAFVSITAMSFSTLLPIFAKDIFKTDQNGFATLMTCNGVGALGSAVSLAVMGRMRHKGKRLLLGAFLFCLSVVAFASSPSLGVACVFLILAGWFLLTFLMTANTMTQTLAPDEIRGRVFSIYSLALVGTTPLGALLIGQLANHLGTRLAVQLSAAVAALFTFWVFLRFRSLWKEK